MLEPKPDIPIEVEEDDRLNRASFARRLVPALIKENRSTGAVIGITGEWGSGKSSLLNLLSRRIESEHPEAIIVRFNPWLVSGRDDVIASFFTAFIDALRERRSNPDVFTSVHDQELTNAMDALARYGGELSPLLNYAFPGLGWIGKTVAKQAEQTIKNRRSLDRQRRMLGTSLRELKTPIIVIVDELDRIEDAEIRVMAQVVRAVADFSEISYVLAYDHLRVMEALGGQVAVISDRLNRGKAYLDKIVQMQISLPISTAHEIRNLAADGLFRANSSHSDRLEQVRTILIPKLIRTPREVSKLCGTVQILYPMLEGEVDWADIVGFAALEMKSPILASVIRRHFEELVFDTVDWRVAFRTLELSPQERVDQFVPKTEEAPVREIFEHLFPQVSKVRSHSDCRPDEIAFRRPLLSLLRLSVAPGALSRKEVERLLNLPISEIKSELKIKLNRDELLALLDRVDDLSWDIQIPRSFWMAFAEFIDEPSGPDVQAAYAVRVALREGALVFMRSFRRKGNGSNVDILDNLKSRRSILLPVSILRRHFFALGLYGKRRSEPEAAIITENDVTVLSDKVANVILKHVETVGSYSTFLDAGPIFLLHDLKLWSEARRRTYIQEIRSSADNLDRLIFWIAAGEYGFDFETLAIFTDANELRGLVQQRLGHPSTNQLPTLLREAYAKFQHEAEWEPR